MDITRYQIVNAILTNDKKIIPIWDERIMFEKTEMYGNVITLKDGNLEYFNLIECIYDLKTKELSLGIELDIYPDKNEYEKDQKVLYEESHRKLKEAVISEIVYEEYTASIHRGKKLDKHTISRLKNANIIDIVPDQLYVLKYWKPFWILDNGTKIEWSRQLYNNTL